MPLLSIIIISHNQRAELQRCVESVLAQQIPFEYEIILSDDRSNDGTFELAQMYASQYPHLIVASQCNSNVCNPANNSQRSGWNRCNGYKFATGKYLAHVDADDYFRPGTHCYQRQVEMLEKHPECSLSMQNVWILQEGDALTAGREWAPQTRFREGRIITADEFIKGDCFILNQAFVQRRNSDVDPIALYGKRYVDSVITYHHLQFGPIVCIDAHDYVYMKHPDAVTTSLQQDDRKVLWNLPVYISAVIPSFSDKQLQYKSYNILLLVNEIRRGLQLTPTSQESLTGLNVFLYQCCREKKLPITHRIRLCAARLLLLTQLKFKLNTHWFRNLIYKFVF